MPSFALVLQCSDYKLDGGAVGYDKHEPVKSRFRCLGDENIVSAQLALRLATEAASIRPTSWAARLPTVRQFVRHLQGFEPRTEVPGVRLLRFRPRQTRPYLCRSSKSNTPSRPRIDSMSRRKRSSCTFKRP